MMWRVVWRVALALVMLGVMSCTTPEPPVPASVGAIADLPREAHQKASSAFWEHWGDGRGEVSVYRGQIARYGELRDAQATLIFVTEPHDRRTWVKDDEVADEHRTEVIKLNQLLDFQTGVYPYRVMTSVFAPVDHWDAERERHSPVKITMGVQEWCGQVFHALWPGRSQYLSRLTSYFESEGDREEVVDVEMGALYADALPLQVRELDGPFLDGAATWTGPMVVSLWRARVEHQALSVVLATITRSTVERDGQALTRFEVTWPGGARFYEVEREAPRGIVRFGAGDGSVFERVSHQRLPYWQLNREGDERAREVLKLPAEVVPPATPDDVDVAPPSPEDAPGSSDAPPGAPESPRSNFP
ncbi:hypothetical protein FRC98_15375 [Lujinxingia vulgaris]|uniref:Lipoprotein n=1 Tax=Lujinxingia vulgaris TaxID=2600176 RepID=A0A5C6XBW1_9DELT|nr:hypothetical protein [Lujinxingia vulgaris]TXD35588.1 hypothetical protein FRC98_15375 [Lujinxingia vulgaris]